MRSKWCTVADLGRPEWWLDQALAIEEDAEQAHINGDDEQALYLWRKALKALNRAAEYELLVAGR